MFRVGYPAVRRNGKLLLQVSEAAGPVMDPGGRDCRCTVKILGWSRCPAVGVGATVEEAVADLARGLGVTVQKLEDGTVRVPA